MCLSMCVCASRPWCSADAHATYCCCDRPSIVFDVHFWPAYSFVSPRCIFSRVGKVAKQQQMKVAKYLHTSFSTRLCPSAIRQSVPDHTHRFFGDPPVATVCRLFTQHIQKYNRSFDLSYFGPKQEVRYLMCGYVWVP